MEVRGWKGEIGSRKKENGGTRLEVRSWKLEVLT